MKFMIVDDEPIVREGLKSLIDWHEMGFTLCGEATDGVEAVSKIMEENPDLVVLDIRIPELSGIEVAEIVRKKGFPGKIIILSGFSDFKYAQNAINHGIEAYLLKPVDQNELIAALEKVREKIQQDNILELYNNQKQANAKNMLLKHILTGSIQCIYQDFSNYGLSLNIRPFQLIMIDYSQYSDIDVSGLCSYWNNLYQHCKSDYLIIEHSIILLIKGQPSIQYFADHIITNLNKTAEDKQKIPFVIISNTFHEVSQFPENFQHIKSISARRFFYYEGNKPVYCKELETGKDITGSEKLNPIEFIERIYKAILDKNTAMIDLSFKKLYRSLQSRNFTIEQTFQVLINCVLELKKQLNETYIKEFIDFDETELINAICQCKTLFDIISLLSERFTLFCRYVKKPSDVTILEKVLNYIDIHYNEDLKLEKIADLFGYNPAYLGRLLSHQVGLGFNPYIEKKRLDKAIELLINTDIRIPDISVIIGYQNVEYFYRKFKKYTKVTPGSFRALYCNSGNKNALV